MRLTAKGLLLGLIGILALRLLAMAAMPFADTSEPRYAEIARLMATTGDWITPWFDAGEPFWGKPPLAFWAQALSIRLFGLSELAVRLPSWLAMLGVLALVHRCARQLRGEQAARWATLLFATMLLPYASAGAVLTDAFLALGITLSMVSFLLAPRDPRPLWRYGFFAGLAIGLLAKGPLALVLTSGAIVPWMLWHRNARAQLSALPWAAGIVLTLALTLPWYIAAELKTPGFLRYFILGEHILRFVDPGWEGDRYGSAHERPYGSIWLDWLLATMPWGAAWLGLLLWPRRDAPLGRRVAAAARDPDQTYLLTWALATPAFFTLSGNILWTYVLPALPPVALALGMRVAQSRNARQGRLMLAGMTLAPAAALVLALLAWLLPTHYKTEKQLVQRAEAAMQSGDRLYFVGSRPFSARYYSRDTAGLVDGPQALTAVLPAPGQRVFLAVRRREATTLLATWRGQVTPLYSSRRYTLLQVAGEGATAP
ncbi:dolichyl-phosphate-mannose--protein mannosyltransferase [Achromobacter denitrificans]|nr:dolichyl-phosphate-mannose--protein mannosyltransferase [Achromobacter denitrificans]